ncbi:MAG: hypothetical protein PHO92_03355 [Candidatus Peribacteraceae bacterium]|nr:hypothetical protein [Candidatus Peribacteraceae bacterium]
MANINIPSHSPAIPEVRETVPQSMDLPHAVNQRINACGNVLSSPSIDTLVGNTARFALHTGALLAPLLLTYLGLKTVVTGRLPWKKK